MKKIFYRVLFLCAVCHTGISYSAKNFLQDDYERMSREIRGGMPPQKCDKPIPRNKEAITALQEKIEDLGFQQENVKKQMDEILQKQQMFMKEPDQRGEDVRKKMEELDIICADGINTIRKQYNEEKNFIERKYALHIKKIQNRLEENGYSLGNIEKELKCLKDEGLVSKEEMEEVLNEEMMQNMTCEHLITSLKKLKDFQAAELKESSHNERIEMDLVMNDMKEKARELLTYHFDPMCVATEYSRLDNDLKQKRIEMRYIEGEIEKCCKKKAALQGDSE